MIIIGQTSGKLSGCQEQDLLKWYAHNSKGTG